ncbi:hypothetical protein IWY39_003703 [Sphingobium sp. JAI105]|nr:hypothetical protein [Sphingobium sp. JAI105]
MRVRSLLFLLACVAMPAIAQSGEPWQPPTLTNTRYEEDWGRLADPANRDGRWTEAFKYIPLGGDAWLSTGIELRARSESYRDNLWGGADAPNNSYLWLRAMPYADLHVGKLRAFVQPIAAYAVGVDPPPARSTRAASICYRDLRRRRSARSRCGPDGRCFRSARKGSWAHVTVPTSRSPSMVRAPMCGSAG